MKNKIEKFNKYIENVISSFTVSGEIKEALAYNLISDGKYLRPQILFAILEDSGLNVEDYFGLALSVEMIHTYSLIHDDLPAMDNDDYRRGKLSCHKKYGEDVAILVGDMLLTNAFGLVLDNGFLISDMKVEIIKNIVESAGVEGMIYGQYMDIKNKATTIEKLNLLHELKTSKMICLPLIIGFIVSKKENLDLLTVFKEAGLLYQIQDDYLDQYGQNLGKTLRKDEKSNKKTYIYYYSKEELEEVIDSKEDSIRSKLKKIDGYDKSKIVLNSILGREK